MIVDLIVLTTAFTLAAIGLWLLWNVSAEAWGERKGRRR